MSINEMENKVQKLQEWIDIQEEAKKEVERLKAEIIAEMTNRGTDELTAGRYIVRNTLVLSNRFDSTAFKKDFEDIYKEYTKQVTSRRFSVA